MVLHALRAGEDGVVVRDGDRSRRLRPEQLGVDGADATDEPVGGRVGDQVVEAAPAPLAGDHDRAVLDERAVVDEVVDVLAGRAPLPGAPFGDGIGTRLVETDAMALQHVGEIGAHHRRAVDGRRPHRHGRGCLLVVGDGLQAHQQIAGHHGRPDGDGQLGHPTAFIGGHVVVHLHRLDEDEHGARSHDVAGRDLERHDRALQRAADLLHVSSSAGPVPMLAAGTGRHQPVDLSRRGRA